MTKAQLAMKTPPIVSPKEWEAARLKLLVKEKKVTRARDALAAERRRMPWLAVEKEYEFVGPDGKASLLDLFEGRHQLIVYRAFFEPPACPAGPSMPVSAAPWGPTRSPTSPISTRGDTGTAQPAGGAGHRLLLEGERAGSELGEPTPTGSGSRAAERGERRQRRLHLTSCLLPILDYLEVGHGFSREGDIRFRMRHRTTILVDHKNNWKSCIQ